MKHRIVIDLVVVAAAAIGTLTATPADADIVIVEVIAEQAMTRAGRSFPVRATLTNDGDATAVSVRMLLPAGVKVNGNAIQLLELPAGQTGDVVWLLESDQACRDQLRVEAYVGDQRMAEQVMPLRFLDPAPQSQAGSIPPPRPANSPLLIGAHHCPLWETERPGMWQQIRKHPERTPALGFYSQDNPEVADWETVWAVEHGIDYFIYCWYRTSQGGPVQTMFESAITKGLFKSKYVDQIKFTIMWENQRRGVSGVADEQDLKENLFPYWMKHFFHHPSYLKVDNRPLLFIYRPEFLVQDLGSEAKVAQALDWMRQACQAEGFDGLFILGEYRGLDPQHLQLMKRLGLDYTFAYCWHVNDHPDPKRAIDTQMNFIRKTEEMKILPQVVTVSQGWTGWRDEGSIWKIPPVDFKTLLRQAGDFVSTIPEDQLGHRMLILDNWNEWGEGHYLAPHTDEGFGYLDAIREVLTDAEKQHQDLIPEDLGMGPYDGPYRQQLKQQKE